MGEGESKDNNNNSNNNNNVGVEKKKQPEQKGKIEDSNYVNVVILKVDIHCKGCANKIIRFLNSFDGVEKIKVEMDANKLTVEGKVDPSQIREKLEEKIKKKVEILSPQPKKDKENKGGGDNNSSSNNNKKNDDSKKKDQEKKSDDKKPKEPPVTTIMVKVVLHCEGCIMKIQKAISKIRGLQSMSIEREKDLVTVTGRIDAKALVDTLKGKIKRTVEIVPQKKEEKKDTPTPKKDNAGGGGGGGGGGGQGKDNKVGDGIGTSGGGGEGKKGGGGGDGGGGGKEGENKKNDNKKIEKMEGNKSEYFGPMPTFANYGYFGPTPTFANYGNMSYGYTSGHMYGDPYHAPQLFSDENPNACSVM